MGIFSSSFCGMFQSKRFSRTDACALACCGVWLWERNKFMVDGTTPKPWRERPYAIAMVVAVTLVGFIYSQLKPESPQLAMISFLGIGGIMLVILCRFQSDRTQFRLELAKKQYYLDHPNESPESIPERDNRNLQFYLYKHQKEISRAHACCGCFPNDMAPAVVTNARTTPIHNDSQVLTMDGSGDDRVHDFCTRIWQFIGSCCCNACCSAWCACCGMCAIAQEHRHLEKTLPLETRAAATISTSSSSPPEVWEHDYITFQRWSEYAPQLQRVRDLNDTSWTSHLRAMSELSSRMVVGVQGLVVFVMVLAILPFIKMSFWQLPILIAALLQPALILYFVYWQSNRFDISLDAVIKYFASGFFICTGMAVAYESLVQCVTGLIMLVSYIIGGIAVLVEAADDAGDDDAANEEEIVEKMIEFILLEAVLSAFLNAFIVAALVEEISKYLCFWMVEHPDMEDASRTPVSRGSMITIAMVSTALGFACAENLMYVFVYTPPNVSYEIITLVMRSLLPIHPLAAAIQSIGVCRRDLEKDQKMQVGRIIFPAWLLHGLYDFVLMVYAAVIVILNGDDLGIEDEDGMDSSSSSNKNFDRDSSNNNYGQGDDYPVQYIPYDSPTPAPIDPDDIDFMEELATSFPSIVVGALIGILGLVWYFNQARLQRQRLMFQTLDPALGVGGVGGTAASSLQLESTTLLT